MHLFPPRRRGPTSTSQQTTRAKVPRSCKGLEDGCWPKRSSSLPTPHRAYPGTTRHCDMVRHSQARHHCGADCTMGGEHGRSLREKETPVRESTHGMRRQRMGVWSDAHRGWLSWLHRRTTTSYLTRLGLTNRARRRATQQLQTAAERASSWIWSKVRKSTTAWQNRPPSSLLPYPHPTPPQPYPSPTLSLPPPTTSIPIPSSAYRASRSTCSPQWHHPVAEAAGGARVWGTTGRRRNHLTCSGRWLTRVMSRQLLLHVVCIYYLSTASAYEEIYICNNFSPAEFCPDKRKRPDIKMSPHQYRNSHYKDKTVSRPSFSYSGILYLGRPSLSWAGTLVPIIKSHHCNSFEDRVNLWVCNIQISCSDLIPLGETDTEMTVS